MNKLTETDIEQIKEIAIVIAQLSVHSATSIYSITECVANTFLDKKRLAAYEIIGEPDEVVKPVRCRECLHSKPHKKVGNGISEPPYITGIRCTQFDLFPMQEGDYCSYGERRGSRQC